MTLVRLSDICYQFFFCMCSEGRERVWFAECEFKVRFLIFQRQIMSKVNNEWFQKPIQSIHIYIQKNAKKN